MNEVEEFERMKKDIEDAKVRLLAARNEKERLESELEEIKRRIKEEYNVDIADFEGAIRTLEAELSEKMESLRRLLAECKSKME